MNLLRTSISSLLLLTYVWGFGHSLIPHCQDDCSAFHHSEDVHHHDHETDAEAHARGDQDHIHHENHVDDNLIDLYICLLSNYEHHGGSSHPPKTDEDNDIRIQIFDFELNLSTIDQSKFFQFEVCDFECIQHSVTNQINAPPTSRYLYLFSHNISFRGPPLYSC